MRTVLTMILASVATLLVFVPDSPAAPTKTNLTGEWSCGDGGTYYLRQVGNELWWSGKRTDGNKTIFANVFHGTIKGNEISGSWVDDPSGNKRGSGTLTLEIGGDGESLQLKATAKTGGFGGKTWKPKK